MLETNSIIFSAKAIHWAYGPSLGTRYKHYRHIWQRPSKQWNPIYGGYPYMDICF